MTVGADRPACEIVVLPDGEKADRAGEDGPADIENRKVTKAGVAPDPPGRLPEGYVGLFGESALGVFDHGFFGVFVPVQLFITKATAVAAEEVMVGVRLVSLAERLFTALAMSHMFVKTPWVEASPAEMDTRSGPIGAGQKRRISAPPTFKYITEPRSALL